MPVAEPHLQRRKKLVRRAGMPLDDLPFGVGRATGLVQYLWRDGELANVVEQCRPSQSVPVAFRQAHLFGDHVGIGADPFRVTAGQTIVVSHNLGHIQQQLREVGVGSTNLGIAGCGHAFAKLFDGASAQCRPVAGGSLIWKHQRHLHESDKRRKHAGAAFCHPHHNGSYSNGHDPPHQCPHTQDGRG